MKRILFLGLFSFILLSFAACTLPAEESDGTPTTATQQPSPEAVSKQNVVFSDPALEAMVRAAMNKPEGDITLADAEAVSALNLSYEWLRLLPNAVPIRKLDGLEHFKNLESIDLSFHEITDISPLARLHKLGVLSLCANPVADITPLANLTNMKVLVLEQSAVSDLSPLADLTGIKHLYLAGCPVADDSPLADIYPGLESKDFVMMPAPSTLVALGFSMDGERKQAVYGNERMDVRINHNEWGYSGDDSMQNCVRVVFGTDEYKVDVGYYPAHDTYVVLAHKNGEFVLNYLYFPANGRFSIGLGGDRESAERHVRASFPNADDEDILLAPVSFYTAAIEDAFDMTATELFVLPFQEDDVVPEQTPEQISPAYALPYEALGFIANGDEAVCRYERHEPHYMKIAVHRQEWGENPREWNIEFLDSDVNGYSLLMWYFADEDKWHVHMEKDGAYCAYDCYPATDTKGWEDPGIEAVHQMVGDACGSQGKELYDKPLEHLERTVRELFDMRTDELYTLPKQ